MLTEKDISSLVEKFGEIWILRDLDFFPEKLSEVSRIYPYKLSTWMEVIKKDSGFITFRTEKDAVEASIKIYTALGKNVPTELYERYWELTHKKLFCYI